MLARASSHRSTLRLSDRGLQLDEAICARLLTGTDRLPLTEYCIYSGQDYAAASRAVSTLAGQRTLKLVEPHKDNYLELHRAPLHFTQIAAAFNAGATDMEQSAPTQTINLVVPLLGTQRIRSRGFEHRLGPGTGVLTFLGARHQFTRATDHVVLVATLTRVGYETLIGTPRSLVRAKRSPKPVVLDLLDERYWTLLAILGTLCRQVNDTIDANPHLDAVIRRLEEALWLRLVDLCPELEPEDGPVVQEQDLPAHVLRVQQFIENDASRDFDLADLVGVSEVSPRSLQSAFRSTLGCSPMAYVRKVKLKRMHDDLLLADPDGTYVADVAAKWGLYHIGNTANYYREEFNELPSDTLRRHAGVGRKFGG